MLGGKKKKKKNFKSREREKREEKTRDCARKNGNVSLHWITARSLSNYRDNLAAELINRNLRTCICSSLYFISPRSCLLRAKYFSRNFSVNLHKKRRKKIVFSEEKFTRESPTRNIYIFPNKFAGTMLTRTSIQGNYRYKIYHNKMFKWTWILLQFILRIL